MERSRAGLVKWALSKADEYLQSASDNLKAERLFPAAEEIFRAVETALEALLYHYRAPVRQTCMKNFYTNRCYQITGVTN
jgi:HEPN domain-containing protein